MQLYFKIVVQKLLRLQLKLLEDISIQLVKLIKTKYYVLEIPFTEELWLQFMQVDQKK